MLIQMTTAQLLCDALPGAITPGTWHALALDAWERGPLRGDEEAWVRNGEEMTRRVEAADFDENREESMRQNIADGEVPHVDEEVVEVPVENGENAENGADWHAVETPDRSAEQGKLRRFSHSAKLILRSHPNPVQGARNRRQRIQDPRPSRHGIPYRPSLAGCANSS
jgi:hypothetical protein